MIDGAKARSRSRKGLASRGTAMKMAVPSLMLDPIITMNAGGYIQSASASVENVFGWTPAELFGRNIKVLIPEPRRSDLDRYLDRYRKASLGPALERTRRFEAICKDGHPIQIELSMSRADLPADAGPYFIGIIREVTNEIDVTADSGRDRTRLQQLVTEQTRALATASLRLQLADRLATLGTLAAGLGHDMNNVLLPVRARLNALEHAGLPAPALLHLQAVRRSIAYLQNLSDGLHDLAVDPDGSGSKANNSGVTDLSRWWKHVGPLIGKAIPPRVTLSAQFPSTLPSVSIAAHWLTQATLNLIVNAGESMPPRSTGSWIKLGAVKTDDGRFLRLSVTDNGRGMTQAIQNRAMDLFFTTKPRRVGTGMGLPLARRAVMRAGGFMEIHSAPRLGTSVVLVLPVAAPGNTPQSQDAPAGRTAAISLRAGLNAALVAHTVINCGFELHVPKGGGPGTSDVWITDPNHHALRLATPWHHAQPGRTAVLLGAPGKSLKAQWEALNAVVIDPADDALLLRHALTMVNQIVAKEPDSIPTSTGRVKRTKERLP